MKHLAVHSAYLLLCFFSSTEGLAEGNDCRELGFYPLTSGKRLENHVIHKKQASSEDFCQALCYMENNCRSINFKQTKDIDGTHLCELNDADEKEHPDDLKKGNEFSYRATKTSCSSNPCKENKTCQTGFGPEGYRCVCPAGYTGIACEEDINECDKPKQCHANASCINTPGSYKCNCSTGYEGNGSYCQQYQFILTDSKILKNHPDYDKTLEEYMQPVNSSSKRWILCFRASEHNFNVADFHTHCDAKGPTVTLVRVGIYVFGGYTDKSWNGNDGFIRSEAAFLFSLKNHRNQQYKMTLSGNPDRATYSAVIFGPAFGGGNDLAIYDHCNNNTKSFSNLGLTYGAPNGVNSLEAKKLLAGSFKFKCDEFEVFYQI